MKKISMRAISITVDLMFQLKVLRQVLFDLRAGNSNLAKSLMKKVNMQCTKMKTHTDACYPSKINKTSNFSPILVTSIHKTDSFRL